MKSYLKRQVKTAASPVQGRNLAREYMQAHILGMLQQAGAMIPLAFHGGTALRFPSGATMRHLPSAFICVHLRSSASHFFAAAGVLQRRIEIPRGRVANAPLARNDNAARESSRVIATTNPDTSSKMLWVRFK